MNDKERYKKIAKLDNEENEQYMIRLGQVVEDAVKEYLGKRHEATAIDLVPTYKKKDLNGEEEEDGDDNIFDDPTFDHELAIRNTIQAINDNEPLLYQPTFAVGNYFVRADFMLRNEDGSYDLIEVKATTGIRKDVTDDGEKKPIGKIKDKLIHDVSFQTFVINTVLEQEWLPPIKDIYLAYLNKEYIKEGDIDIQRLILLEQVNLTKEFYVIQRGKEKKITRDDKILDTQTIRWYTQQMQQELALDESSFNALYPWDGAKYIDYFGEDRPFGTIMGAGMNKAKVVQELYSEDRTNIMDLTDDEKALFENQWGWGKTIEFIENYIQCTQTGKSVIDYATIQKIFNGFNHPICFYDYESVCTPIPIIDRTYPYQHTVFQYSLHKYYPDGHMEHFGWVFVWEWDYKVEQITIDDNPNKVEKESEKVVQGTYEQFLQEFLKDIGDDIDKSTFIVWHKGFENARNNETAELFPQLADAFNKINEATYDLKEVFSNGHYFDIAFKWSASIKKVLPAMVPEMTYEWMEIGNGLLASQILYKLVSNKIIDDGERIHKIKKLLLYCGQDSIAMMKIWEKVKNEIE